MWILMLDHSMTVAASDYVKNDLPCSSKSAKDTHASLSGLKEQQGLPYNVSHKVNVCLVG